MPRKPPGKVRKTMPPIKANQVIKTGPAPSGKEDKSWRGFGGGKMTDRGIKK